MPSASRSAAATSRALTATSTPARPLATTQHPASLSSAFFMTPRTPRTCSCRSSQRLEIGDWTAWALHSGQRADQECQSVFCQRVLRLGWGAPNSGGAGDGLVVGGEGFDGHGAVVPDRVQRGCDGLPGNVVGPWSTPIVAASSVPPTKWSGNPRTRDGVPFAGRTWIAHRRQSTPAGAVRSPGFIAPLASPTGGMAGVEITYESRADGRMTVPRHKSEAP